VPCCVLLPLSLPAPCFRLPPSDPVPYTFKMATPPQVAPRQVGILVLDEDSPSASALRQILDSEGWRVRIVNESKHLMVDLRTADWSLVIANVSLIGLDSAAFQILRELATVPLEEGGRLRALFLIPEMTGSQYVGPLESARLPYVVRPYHLHDFLEKVSDLLVEVKAIDAPLRQVRREFGTLRKKKQQSGRVTSMFASRDSYSYTDEEIAEYERQEAETSKTKRQKPRINLGNPYEK
jgi:DNA-binding response OmpR family regulator